MDLFDQKLAKNLKQKAPLADRIRPRSLDDFVGQEKIIGPETLLRRAIKKDDLPSMIFWGPPGSGKTTLAHIVAKMTNSKFIQMSAVTAGIKDLREVIKQAKDKQKFNNQSTILFIDEIHRWNKAQQDALLPHVEKGVITLIGATTENPSFEVVAPLLSRCRVYVLEPLSQDNLKKIIKRALADKEKGLGKLKVKISPQARNFLITTANGDARTILNALEIAAKNIEPNKGGKRRITQKIIEQALQHKALRYDKGGEEHYNTISAFIKSLRGSKPEAALYWLARMLEAGEDPKFIARRMVIFASEDIGNALPTALVVANAVFEAVEKIGLPECQLNLSQGAIYLAQAPKSRDACQALEAAQGDVKKYGNLPVPLHLRNAPTKLMKKLGYGKKKKGQQNYRPKKIQGNKYLKQQK